MYPQYTQVLGMGLLWVTVHCSGMCGPIMAGLTLGADPSLSRWRRAARSLQRVLAYQTGRALMYALLGAAAGALGAALEETISSLAHTAGLIVAIALVAAGIARLPWIAARLPLPDSGAAAGRFVGRVLKRLRAARRSDLLTMAAVGFVMGLLPCMLMFWVLGLAASTAHLGHGAGVMLTLVALTTPMLALVGVVPHLVGPKLRQQGERLIPFGVILSGLWLGLITAASNGWIPHAHVSFQLGAEPFAIMFW